MKKKTYFVIIALALVFVAVIVGTVVIERQNGAKKEAELMAERKQLSANMWTYDNTIDIEGQLLGFDHRLETFLFVGTDASGSGKAGVTGEHQPMADFIMLMVLDHTRNAIGFLQIDRNAIVPVNALDEKGKLIDRQDYQICAAYWYGLSPEMGAENLIDSVRSYLGALQKIDGYYVINMEDIEKLNAAMGGVEVTIDADLTSRDPAFEKGKTVKLTDAEAEAFLRARVGLEDESNVARMGRQRQYMSGLLSKARENCEADPQYALKLWDMLRGIATTNMNGNDFSRIAQKLLKGENMGFKTFDGESTIGYRSSDGLPHEEFHANPESKKAVLTELFSLVPVESTREMDEALEEQEAEEAADVAEEELDAEEWMKMVEDDDGQDKGKNAQIPATESDLKK